VTGVSYGSGGYPRTELREAHSDGSLYNWKYTSFDSSLSATLTVTQTPTPEGKIVVGQILDTGAGGISTHPMVEIYFNSYDKQVYIQYRNLPTDSSTQPNVVLLTNVYVPQTISYVINLTSGGVLSVAINGVVGFTKQMDSAWASQGLYFQAGDYVQDNSGLDTEGGRVVFMDLVVIH